MLKRFSLIVSILLLHQFVFSQTGNSFPDGTSFSTWLTDATKIQLEDLGTRYTITDFGVVNDSTILQTKAIQSVIDRAAKNGGGVIIIPEGTYLSGALYFKPNTHLHITAGGVLKGSDNIADYPLIPSRMEGQNLDYYSALINVYNVDNFTLSGHGTINGNGLNYWKAFWQRRAENPKCTNLEVSRPRLVFVWRSDNVQFQDIREINSGFWTNHFYQCNNVKLLDLHIFSPRAPIKAPSTDAIDIDVCSNVLVKGCYLSVNDDAIALKGGKGPQADKDSCNGPNTNILIEDCEFGFCHSALTNGSEAIHNRNIIMRNCTVNDAQRLLWLKMRPDTPQKYEFITVENITGQTHLGIDVYSWQQFFDLKGHNEIPLSSANHITLRNLNLKCDTFYDIEEDPNIRLSNFTFENLQIESKNSSINKKLVDGIILKNVIINKQMVE